MFPSIYSIELYTRLIFVEVLENIWDDINNTLVSNNNIFAHKSLNLKVNIVKD